MRAFITLSKEASKKLEAYLDIQQTVGFYSNKQNRFDNKVVPQELDFFEGVCTSYGYEPTPADVPTTDAHLAGVFNPIPENGIVLKGLTQWWNPADEAKYHLPGKAMGYISGKGENTDGGNWVVFFPQTRRLAVGGRRHGFIKLLEAADINNLYNNNFENFQYPEGATETDWIKPWQVLNKDNQERVALTIQKKVLKTITALTQADNDRFEELAPKIRKDIVEAFKALGSDAVIKEVVDALRKASKVEGFRRDRINGFLTKTVHKNLDALKILFNVRLSPEVIASLGGVSAIYLPKKSKGGSNRVPRTSAPVQEAVKVEAKETNAAAAYKAWETQTTKAIVSEVDSRRDAFLYDLRDLNQAEAAAASKVELPEPSYDAPVRKDDQVYAEVSSQTAPKVACSNACQGGCNGRQVGDGVDVMSFSTSQKLEDLNNLKFTPMGSLNVVEDGKVDLDDQLNAMTFGDRPPSLKYASSSLSAFDVSATQQNKGLHRDSQTAATDPSNTVVRDSIVGTPDVLKSIHGLKELKAVLLKIDNLSYIRGDLGAQLHSLLEDNSI